MLLLVGIAGMVVLAGTFAYENSEHFARRIDGFLNPEVDPTTQLGYATNAIQEGGIFGVGVGEGSVATTIRAGKHAFVVDEPAALAGDDVAPSPVEFALGALISCQVVVYRLYARALGIQVDDITIDAEGDLDARRLFGIDEGVRAGFSDVRLAITITGPESQERYEHLREAVDAHCPVLDLFANATPVTATVRKG